MNFRILGEFFHNAGDGMAAATDPTFQTISMQKCNFLFVGHERWFGMIPLLGYFDQP
jgi:hypothetical protein